MTRRIAGAAALLAVGAATWATGVATAAVTWTLVATPLAVSLMLAIQVQSCVNTIRRRPVTWRARVYAERKG